MGKILSLREAINLIWEIVEVGQEVDSGCPYLFIVGAGISSPEGKQQENIDILTSVKEKVKV